MKKRIAAVLVCLMMVVSFFAGCNLFERDMNAYLSQTVAKVNGVEVTKEELINSLGTYGSTLINSYGYTQAEAVDYLVDYLMDKKILLKYIKKLVKQEEIDTTLTQNDYKYALTNNEYNEIVESVWGYVDDSLEEIRKTYTSSSSVFPSVTEPTAVATKTVFEPTVTVEERDSQIVIVRKEKETTTQEEKLNKYSYVAPVFNANIDSKVWNKYIAQLKTNEEYKKLSTDDASVFNREIDRMFTILYEEKLMEKYQETYDYDYGFDSNGVMNETATQEILNYFTRLYDAEEEAFANTSNAAFYSAMISTSNRGNVFCIPESDEFYEFSHILVQFDVTNQKDKITEAKNDALLSDAEREAKISGLESQESTKTQARTDGVAGGDDVSVADIVTELEEIVANLQAEYSGEEYVQKLSEEFEKLVFKYSDDTGMFNLDFNYAVGLNNSGMIEEFTAACRDLVTQGEGSISAPILGTTTDSSGVETQGYHIILYTRKVPVIVNNSEDITIERLNELYTSRTSGKTYLEYILSSVRASNYSNHTTLLLSELKGGQDTIKYSKRYKDLLGE